MKAKRVTTWNARPAIMMSFPSLGSSRAWDLAEAMPPPAAWRSREMTSQGMNCKELGWLICRDGKNQWPRVTYNSGIPFWRDARVLCSECTNDAAQAEIDASRHKCRCDCQADNLHQKPVLTPLVLPTHDPAYISQHLKKGPRCHRKRECMITPSAPLPCHRHGSEV